jgi:phospholipase C
MMPRPRAPGRGPVAAAALRRAAAVAMTLAVALAGCARAAPARPATASSPAATAPHPGTATSGRAATASATVGAAAGAPAAPQPPALPAFRHVFLVVMENLGYSAAMATPSLASLAHRYAYATNYDAVAHPSLPNYLALASGGTWGVASDCTACYRSEPNLASQLAGAGISWGAYMEGLPRSCDLTAYDLLTGYAGKHDPFRYFTDVRGSRALCGRIQPLTALNLDQPPRFAWITPDLCHDGHDCPAAQAGAWLDGFVARVTASAAWRDGGVLFVTWDEGSDDAGGGGHVLTLVIAPGLPAGEQVASPLNHYSLLHTIEAGLGLDPLGLAAGAPLMSAFWAPAATGRRSP